MALTQYSPLTNEDCQRARQARDARYDGRFYVAVKTTGIFCRPICPANLPKEHNVEYFTDQAQALQAGYRPCLRCRPDSAPGSWAWQGVETTFQRAIKLIEQELGQQCSLASLADRLGISDRYLRALFAKYLGMSPKKYLQYQQLMFAKQLLHNSAMSVTDIGYASGFNSTRRFNDAFQHYLKLTPSQVRRMHRAYSPANRMTLAYQGPLAWSQMLDFYRLRAIAAIEQVDDVSYQRRFQLQGSSGWFQIAPGETGQLTVQFELDDVRQLRQLVARLRRMFDLDADVLSIEQHLQSLAPGLVKQSGWRIPGVWNAWEAGVRAILGQQVSVKAAIGQLNLLVDQLSVNGAEQFPSPDIVAQADVSFLKMPQSRKQTLVRLAQHLSAMPDSDPNEWLALKGIGPWTVSYAKLRGLSEPNAFLHSDLMVKKVLPQFDQLNEQSASPWGSYATFHCWSHGS
ncbi:DNA-3-methyladenine glycosylase 2 family protein [Vibrio sp.]|uniref:DNA-3-methyladenine glycosylase 2 family protein n=1 Tax=Vibrio sp. TaxID=678 RepID=UPI003D0A0468